MENTAQTGEYLYAGLERLAERYPGEIQNLRGRGQGTFLAWDSPRRDDFLKRAKGVGVNVGGSGERAVRLRPMLIFQKHHGKFPPSYLESCGNGKLTCFIADIFLEATEKLISS